MIMDQKQVASIFRSILLTPIVLVLCSGFGNGQTGSRPAFLKLSEASWQESSFWGSRIAATRLGLSKSMTPLMLGAEKSQFVKNFRIAAGQEDGKHRGPAWNDGDCYKWIEALSALYAQSPDPTLKKLLDEVIEIIAAAQRSDGYIHTPVIIASRDRQSDAKALSDPANFEMYNMGHLLTAACVHAEATGDRNLLSVAIKAADYLDRTFRNPDLLIARHAICPAHYMGAIDLYRTTGDPRYLHLCQRWMNMRDIVQGGGDDNQDRLPFYQQREAVGHAVRANYLFAGAADLYFETKDDRLLDALTACWENVQRRKIYITGGCGALYDGASPDGSDKQSSITRIHQAYGRNYQLPNATAHNETCAAIGNVLWNQRMWHIKREAKYIDALENSLYNAVLAGVSLDGERYFYTNTLRQLNDMPVQLRWPRQRQSWISCYCCPPNVARTIAQVGRYAYSVDETATVALLYGSNTLKVALNNNQQIAIQQDSDYPVDGIVRLQIKQAPDSEYTIGFRIPGWCPNARLFVNGTRQALETQPSSIASIKRRWAVDDEISLELDMPVQYLTAHPLVEECQGQIAVRRGPLIYCVESTDLPRQTSMHQVRLASDREKDWSLTIGRGPLTGVPQLSGKLQIVPIADSSQNVAEEPLYRPLKSVPSQSVEAKLTPYFAWGNRGSSEMTVWIQVQQ